jgi:hypothetical protein
VYIHPYEIETTPGPAEIEREIALGDARTRRFHALQLRRRGSVWGKLERLLTDFRFGTMRQAIESVLGPEALT